MVKSIVNGVIAYYPGRHYNKTVDGTSQKVEKYYIFASLTVAIKTIENGTETLKWLLTDHLGSTNVTANADGSWNSLIQYSAFGEIWKSNGVTPTDYRYTSQLSQVEIGLYYYNARWYDPALGRFVQADTIVPGAGGAQSFDRYAYILNNPINGIDPFGHSPITGNCSSMIDGDYCSSSYGTQTKKSSEPSHRYTVADYKRIIKTNYGVTLAGNWSLQNAKIMFNVLNSVDNKMNGELIDFSWGNIFYFSYDEAHYGGRAHPSGNIYFHSFGAIPYQTAYHEVAHMINYESGNFFTNRLESVPVITTAGEHVMGGLPYNRNSQGYLQNYVFDPNFKSVEAEQHSNHSHCDIAQWCEQGNSANEEWADVFANYISDNLYVATSKEYDDFGIARFNWINSVMSMYSAMRKP